MFDHVDYLQFLVFTGFLGFYSFIIKLCVQLIFHHEQLKEEKLPWTRQQTAWELHLLCTVTLLGCLQWC